MAEALHLKYPVNTIDGQQLLPAGTELTVEVLERLATAVRHNPGEDLSLLEHGSIRTDLGNLMNREPYMQIFGDPADLDAVWEMMAPIRLPPPLLTAIDYFCENDPYTYSHTLMVFALTCLLAQKMGGNVQEALPEASAGPLHDIGKVSVPLQVLQMDAPLHRSDRDLFEHHAMAGYVLLTYYLGAVDSYTAVAARDHHERSDCSGYPRGIALMDQYVEIVSVCDVYDALLSSRPYRKTQFDNRTALEEITRLAEKGKVGWRIVTHLLALNRRDRPSPADCSVSHEKRGVPPEANTYGIVIEDEPTQES
ncbi:HD domain-containing protein [bacterium]|nr:HD domain-containing protein [bacterium]